MSPNDYYPFGMVMPGRKFEAESAYRYGFNGKENDNEVKGESNQQDYGMRIYDSRLGRFLSVDPLIKKYPELSPYQFASNTPILAVDLDGMEAVYISGQAEYMLAIFGNEWTVGIAIDAEGIALGGSYGAKFGLGASASAGVGVTFYPGMDRLEEMSGKGESMFVSGEFMLGAGVGVSKSNGHWGVTGNFSWGFGAQLAYEQSKTLLSQKITWKQIADYLSGIGYAICGEGLRKLTSSLGLNGQSTIKQIKDAIFGAYMPLMIDGYNTKITETENLLVKLKNTANQIDASLDKLNKLKDPTSWQKDAKAALEKEKKDNDALIDEKQKELEDLNTRKNQLEEEQ